MALYYSQKNLRFGKSSCKVFGNNSSGQILKKYAYVFLIFFKTTEDLTDYVGSLRALRGMITV